MVELLIASDADAIKRGGGGGVGLGELDLVVFVRNCLLLRHTQILDYNNGSQLE